MCQRRRMWPSPPMWPSPWLSPSPSLRSPPGPAARAERVAEHASRREGQRGGARLQARRSHACARRPSAAGASRSRASCSTWTRLRRMPRPHSLALGTSVRSRQRADTLTAAPPTAPMHATRADPSRRESHTRGWPAGRHAAPPSAAPPSARAAATRAPRTHPKLLAAPAPFWTARARRWPQKWRSPGWPTRRRGRRRAGWARALVRQGRAVTAASARPHAQRTSPRPPARAPPARTRAGSADASAPQTREWRCR